MAVESKPIDYRLDWGSMVPIYEAVFAFDLPEAVSRNPAPALIVELMPQEEEDLRSQVEALAGLIHHAGATTNTLTHGAVMDNQRDEIAWTILSLFTEPEAREKVHTVVSSRQPENIETEALERISK